MTHSRRVAAVWIALGLLVSAGVAQGQRDNNPATESVPRVMPYRGVLSLEGAPIDGPMDMRFTLYDASADGNPVWQEEWIAQVEREVLFTRGRFSVTLGRYTPIEPALLDADGLYLGVEVRRPDQMAWVPLAGRQRLNPTAFSLWAPNATDLTVSGNTRARQVDVTGSITFEGSARATNRLYVGERLRFGLDPAFSYNADADRLLVSEPGAYPLMVQMLAPTQWGAADYRENLSVYHTPTFTGSATVRGATTLNGVARFNGSLRTEGDTRFVGTSRFERGTAVDQRFRAEDTVVFERAITEERNGTVGGNLTVRGDISMNDCSLCLTIQNTDGDRSRMACVRMSGNNGSGWANIDQDINNDDRFGLAYLCLNIGNFGGVGASMP